MKPVTRSWLYKKYVTEGLGTIRIAKLVDRDPKNVYTWLVDWNIPIRKRKWVIDAPKERHRDAKWLRRQYIDKKRSAYAIAKKCGVVENTVLYFLSKFGIARRTAAEVRSFKYWGSGGDKNPMFGRSGSTNPNWQGGHTPERQRFYSSAEWKKAAKEVRKRDRLRCRRCEKKLKRRSRRTHIHHIIPFRYKKHRADPDNLVLLCRRCHRFVHSRKNTKRLFLPP